MTFGGLFLHSTLFCVGADVGIVVVEATSYKGASWHTHNKPEAHLTLYVCVEM